MNQTQFIARMKNILEYNNQFRSSDRELSGKVSMKRLSKYSTSRNIFTKVNRMNYVDKKYYISLLIDCSGSVFNHRLDTLMRNSVDSLQKTFSQIDGIVYEMVLFGQTDIIVKQYDTSLTTEEFNSLYNKDTLWDYSVKVERSSLSNIVDTIEYSSDRRERSIIADNNDALYVYRALERNKHLEKGQHIIIVLSDGSPTVNRSYQHVFDNNTKLVRGSKKQFELACTKESSSAIDNLKNVVKNSKTPIIGIGIKVDYVKNIYPYYSVISNEIELFQGILRHLTRLIKKYAY